MPSSLTLDWITKRPAARADRVFSYFTLPAFALTGLTWKGASEIVRQYNYSATKNFSLRNRPVKPTDADFVLCIRYRIGDSVYRYKLWGDDNLVLNGVSLYSGQVIKKNFCLEIWSLNGETTATLDESITLRSGIMQVITDYSDTPADTEDATGSAVSSLNADAVPSLTPSSFGTLRLWLKADAGVTGDPLVTAWDDQSGNGYNLEVAIDSPSYSTTGFGDKSLPYIRFPGANEGLINGSVPTNPWLLYYIAMRVNVWASSNFINDSGDRTITFDPTASKIRSAWVVNSDVEAASVLGQPIILRVDGIGAPFKNRMEIVALSDISTVVSSVENSTGAFVPPTPTAFWIGNNAGSSFDVAEILGYSGGLQLSSENDQMVKSYLVRKYMTTAAAVPISFDSGSQWLDNE